MSDELLDFHHEFFQDVLAEANAGGKYAEDVFFEKFCDQLVEAGDLDTADRAHYVSPRGLKVDGYGGDPLSAEGVLSLIVIDYSPSCEILSLTRSEIEKHFKRVTAFIEKARDDDFRDRLEETSPAFGLADLINARWKNIDKIRLFLISNRNLSARVDGVPASEIDGIAVTHSIWDLSRLHRFASSGTGREDITINLEKDFGGALPILPAHLEDAGYEAYLVVVPGVELAAIYDRWSSRLLESNVRVFLQARAKVNKGIRNTLEHDPSMFFAYNNGVTATAEAVEIRSEGGSSFLTGLTNLQIVNGGQTTASIYAARKKNVDLSKVFVQMKLSIVPHERALDVVPKISEYANTQNKVNAADFFANHRFHVRIESFSRRVYAPASDDSLVESKWFYERARGQYLDAKAYLTVARKKKFGIEYPKRQVFSKTDLAKYLMVWEQKPDQVSEGAQKNFAKFAPMIAARWEKSETEFNENFYREVIAKAIVFRSVERLVSAQPWYQGGYRANIVAYTISKIAHDVQALGRAVNFNEVWKRQALTPGLEDGVVTASAAIHDVITNPPPTMRNVTEWAKKQACWHRVSELRIDYPASWQGELMSRSEQAALHKDAKSVQKIDNGIEAQKAVFASGGDVWKQICAWGLGRGLISAKEKGILDICASIPNKVPSEKQCVAALSIMQRMHQEGCRTGLEPGI